MKRFSKLIPAIVLLLVSAIMMSTATYAWFSMNNRVTVTGMEVKTKVSSNLYVKASTLNAHDGVVENFKKDDSITLTDAPVLLQPVSTADGVNFFYTNGQDNVKADGSVINSSAFIAYADTTEGKAAFSSSANVANAVGYVDFIYELVALNTTGEEDEIRLTEMKLTYTDTDEIGSDATASENAFRVAVFVEKYNDTPYTGATSTTLKSIMGDTGSAYFTPTKAVASTGLADVTKYAQAVSSAVAVTNDPQFYQVIIRMWIEGEDTTCKNATYADLSTGTWKLDLAFILGDGASAITVMSDDYVASSATP